MKPKSILSYFFIFLLTACISSCTDEKITSPETSDATTRGSQTTIFSNQTVTTNKTVSGTDILSENITVTNNALLVLKGSNSVTINKPFTVNLGSQLQITH